jgi:hypothetical protein
MRARAMLTVSSALLRAAYVSSALALAAMPHNSSAQKLYKHVDEKGNVSFSDRPQKADQKSEKTQKPNVASREATRQTQIGEQNSRREEAAERMAAQRRAAAVAQRERAEKAKQQRAEEESNPSRAPRQVRIVR